MSDYLKVTTVQVVQSIDLEELGKTLGWLVQRVQELPQPGTEPKTIADSLLQDQIDQLRRENQGLKDAVKELQAKQDDLESRLDTKQDRDQAAAEAAEAGAGPGSAAELGELGKRLEQLEERVAAQEAAAPATAAAAVSHEASTAAAAAPSDVAAQLQELRQGQEALAASVGGLQSELDTKPSRAELEGKANRSELDALLKAGVSPAAAAGGDAAAAAPALAVGADGSVDSGALVEAVNRAAADVAAVRGQVAMMADRLGSKADQATVADLAAKLGAVKAAAAVAAPAVSSAAAAAPASSAHAAAAAGEPAASASALNGLAQRVGELEARVAAGAADTPTPAAAAAETAAAAAAAEQAVDSIGALSDVQPLLKELYGKVEGKADRSMLGDALRKLQDLAAALEGKADAAAVRDLQARMAAAAPAAAPAAAATAAAAGSGDGKEQQWVVSHEVKAGDGDSELAAGLEELRGRVAALAAQVAALEGSRPPSAAAVAAGANGHVVPPLATHLRSPSVSEGHDLASVQAALSSLHGQLGELSTRLAGKADGRDVAALELALNAKADLDELAELRLALGGKADGGALEQLQVAVAGKPDQAALDEVKLMAATALDVAGSAAPAAGGEGGEGKPAAGGFSNLLDSVKGMVADRATKAELAALQSQLGGKASAEELAAVRAALDDKASAAEVAALGSAAGHAGRGANSEEIASLDARMGDVFAEIAKIRADLAALPPADVLAAAAAGGGAAGAAGGFLSAREGTPSTGADGAAASGGALARMVSALNREVGSLKEGLDTVAHAANVLAVGLDSATRGGGAGGVQGRYSESGGAGAGKEDRSPRGGYERLLKLMGSGEYRMKMDAFDPTALQQMAQKLAYLEATLKSPAMGRIAAGGGAGGLPDMGIKDLERQVKRLATDVRLLRDKLMDGAGGGGGGGGGTGRMMAPGDHAMLAARPITGYRCMACDRPLDQLDVLPGPHIPTQQLPIRVPAATDVSTRGQVARGSARPGVAPDPLSPQSSAQKLQYNTDPNVRGVQNWYKDATGMAAEALPPQHVGPHLPPGGWRPSNPGMGKLTGAPSLPTLNNAPKARSPATSEALDRVQAATPIMEGPANTSLPQIS
ncbi:hypothetical protein HXX76_004455 [Chlamydomonas incerta]|uniref:Flagellar associated protein n=1 Tax=Chlamydomonas incerta TaxID=51695 RepID=A0A835W5N5_CHLIN|nr:hypothetical protein HXX76_004455 [Chlamydomonas incerta]|eukprot:KAG2440350.1 hypothetical protein HXX76_004455 [Chlamydomonas incerta]